MPLKHLIKPTYSLFLFFLSASILSGCATQELFRKDELLVEKEYLHSGVSIIHVETGEEDTIFNIMTNKKLLLPSFREQKIANISTDCIFIKTKNTYYMDLLAGDNSSIDYLNQSNNIENVTLKITNKINKNETIHTFINFLIKPTDSTLFENNMPSGTRYMDEKYYIHPLASDDDIIEINNIKTCNTNKYNYLLTNNKMDLNIIYSKEKYSEKYRHSTTARILVSPFALLADIIITPINYVLLSIHGM